MESSTFRGVGVGEHQLLLLNMPFVLRPPSFESLAIFLDQPLINSIGKNQRII